MIYSAIGALVSGVIIIALIAVWQRNLHPKFIFPSARLPLTYRSQRLAVIIMGIGILLLPLQIAFPSHQEAKLQNPLPVQIILDVSLSMASYDIPPSRFSVAKSMVQQLTQTLSGYALSLISFSGIPVLTFPFTYDTQGLSQAVSQTSLGDFPPVQEFLGTAIGDALLLGVKNIQTLRSREGRIADPVKPTGIIVLITDGDSNEGYNPQDILPVLQKQHIPVFALGIGTQNYLIGYDRFQDPIVSNLNEDLLQTIAQQTSGKYMRATTSKAFNDFLTTVLQDLKSHEELAISTKYRYLQPYLLWMIGAGLLLRRIHKIYFLLQYLKKKQKTV